MVAQHSSFTIFIYNLALEMLDQLGKIWHLDNLSIIKNQVETCFCEVLNWT